MSKLLWQVLKTAPLAVGSSLLLVNGAIAAQNPDVAIPSDSQKSVELNLEASAPTVEAAAEVPKVAELNFETPAPVEVASEIAPANNSSTLGQIESYSSQGIDSSLGQSVQGASKFRDVRPTDWAFQALDDLIKRYDCLVGYPDGTFRGNRALSRYEFAAGLNSCLNQIERLIASATTEFATKEDLETLRRLMQEFEGELATLGTRVDNLEARTAFLEDHQFSTTTKLKGEVIFALADVFTDLDQQFDTNFNRRIDTGDARPGGGNTVFADRARLNFDTSFTGKDLLRVRLQARATPNLIPGNLTREGRLGWDGNDNNNVAVDDLYYRTPILNSKARLQVWANSSELNDIFDPISPFSPGGTGALSRFGRFNPLYRVGGQDRAAFALDANLADWLNVAGAYTAGESELSGVGQGLFNGDNAIAGQVTLKPFDGRLKIGLLYVHGYRGSSVVDGAVVGGGVDSGTGTLASSFRVRNTAVSPAVGGVTPWVPVVTNNYGINANFDITKQIFVGGWIGYTAARAINTGDGDIWNWAGYAGLNDFGGAGNRLGFIFGREPYLAGSSPKIGTLNASGLGNNLGNRADADTSYHFEGFYQIKVNNYIQVTPGIIAITNPGGQSLNDTLWIGTVRTTFTF